MTRRPALLTGPELERLQAAELTYAEVGATRGPLPAGCRHLTRSRTIGSGRARYEQAAATLMSWGMQQGAGMTVAASAEHPAVGVVALQRLGPGRLSLPAPVRVVYVDAGPSRTAFGYGTLPGHQVSGEEGFAVELTPDGRVVATVTAFSRPASVLVRLAGPLAPVGQRIMAGRYLRSV